MIFEPFELGPYMLRNRLVALPVFSGYALPDGRVSSLLVERYARLADSGVSMVVVANVAVAADGVTSRYNLRIDHDDFLPGLSRLAKAIKQGGALACLQLNHAGRFAKTERPLMPSAIESSNLAFNITSLKDFMNSFPLEQRFRLTKDFLHRIATWKQPMTPEDKERILSSFGKAATRACRAGFDLIEIHGATGYLLAQFLSGYTHKLPAGGEKEFRERVAYPLEVFREVKRHIPQGFPVGFRLLLQEWVPSGIDLDEALAFASLLEKERVAYLSPSAGTYNSIFLSRVRKITARPAYLREETAALTHRVRVPVMISGRIIRPSLADQLLNEGVAELIGLGRSLITDIEWVQKAKAGQRVTACFNCGSCLKRVILEQGLTCARWPQWFQERIKLEHKLLGRDISTGLWVVAHPKDIETLRAALPIMLPTEHEIATRILLLQLEGKAPVPDPVWQDLINWANALWASRGFTGGSLTYSVKPAQRSPDRQLQAEVDKGHYGVVFLGRKPQELWRERFLYKQRGKVVGLIGPHKNRTNVLVPVDLSPTTLLVLRYLNDAIIGKTPFQLHFVHILEGSTAEARRRWAALFKILGWKEHFELLLIPARGDVGSQLLDEIRSGGYGTIIMGKRGLGGIKRWLLGSVSAKVVRGVADQSVVLID